MADPVYPVLAVTPTHPIKKTPLDNTIESDLEGGYEYKRLRSTRKLHELELKYPLLLDAEKEALEAFFDQVETVVVFSWTHPLEGTTYSVRAVKKPGFLSAGGTSAAPYWSTEFTLREA